MGSGNYTNLPPSHYLLAIYDLDNKGNVLFVSRKLDAAP